MSDTFNYWDLDTGLLNDCDFTIESAEFGFDTRYNEETLLLKLTGIAKGDDGTTTPDAELLYPCGKKWEPVDGGQRAQHETGKPKGFNNSSGIGLLIGAAIEAGAMDEFQRRGTPPHNAQTWVGLSFHMEQKEKDYGGEIGKKSRLLPTKFLGVNGSVPSSPSTSSAPAAAAPASSSSNGGLSPVLKAKLKKLAGECSTHDEFIDRAFSGDLGVDGNPEAEAAVADEGAIWAEVKG